MVARALLTSTVAAGAALSGPALAVLTYHRVLPEPDPMLSLEPDAELFRRQMAFLAAHTRVLPLDEAVRRLRAGDLPRQAVSITFDDGYANNHDVALPILKAHGLTATFFVASGYLDGGVMWNDALTETLRRCRSDTLDLDGVGLGRHDLSAPLARRAAVRRLIAELKYRPPAERTALVDRIVATAKVELPRDLMMTSDQVRALQVAGMQIGGHTVTHPILARVDDATARREIVAGREALAAITNRLPSTFAFPNGRPDEDYLGKHAAMAREAGFECAVSTQWSCATRDFDIFEIPRLTLWSRNPFKMALNLASAYARPAKPAVRRET